MQINCNVKQQGTMTRNHDIVTEYTFYILAFTMIAKQKTRKTNFILVKDETRTNIHKAIL